MNGHISMSTHQNGSSSSNNCRGSRCRCILSPRQVHFLLFLFFILLTAVLQSVFGMLIGFVNGESPCLRQPNHSYNKVVNELATWQFPDVFEKLTSVLLVVTWIWIAILRAVILFIFPSCSLHNARISYNQRP